MQRLVRCGLRLRLSGMARMTHTRARSPVQRDVPFLERNFWHTISLAAAVLAEDGSQPACRARAAPASPILKVRRAGLRVRVTVIVTLHLLAHSGPRNFKALYLHVRKPPSSLARHFFSALQ